MESVLCDVELNFILKNLGRKALSYITSLQHWSLHKFLQHFTTVDSAVKVQNYAGWEIFCYRFGHVTTSSRKLST